MTIKPLQHRKDDHRHRSNGRLGQLNKLHSRLRKYRINGYTLVVAATQERPIFEHSLDRR